MARRYRSCFRRAWPGATVSALAGHGPALPFLLSPGMARRYRSHHSWMRATLSSEPLASFSPFLMLTNSTLFFASRARLFGWVGTA